MADNQTSATGTQEVASSSSPAFDPDGAAIALIGVHKWYGSFHVLRNIDLKVRRGEN
jgi:general L-amino acid transport system ATP-binding protein